jgi:hypothetical protein
MVLFVAPSDEVVTLAGGAERHASVRSGGMVPQLPSSSINAGVATLRNRREHERNCLFITLRYHGDPSENQHHARGRLFVRARNMSASDGTSVWSKVRLALVINRNRQNVAHRQTVFPHLARR